jgi:hypothetical protein
MVYGVGRMSGGSQILDGGHSSGVFTVGVVDYVCGDTKASAVQYVPDTCSKITPLI